MKAIYYFVFYQVIKIECIGSVFVELQDIFKLIIINDNRTE